MWKLISVFVTIQLFCLAFSKELPPSFKICKRSDPDISGCLKVAIQDALSLVRNGLPDFKFPPMEPLRIERMTIGQGTGVVQVVQKFKDVDIYNLTNAVLDDVKVNVSDTAFLAELYASKDLITFKARYELDGKVLILPIVGEGPCLLELRNIKAKIILNGTAIEKKGELYIKLTDVNVSLDPESVGFKFDNLFNGNKELGDAMNKVLNENNLLVYSDVRSGYEEFLSIVFRDLGNKIFGQVPIKNLFPL